MERPNSAPRGGRADDSCAETDRNGQPGPFVQLRNDRRPPRTRLVAKRGSGNIAFRRSRSCKSSRADDRRCGNGGELRRRPSIGQFERTHEALPVIASSAPASGRSLWMKRAIRFSIHSGRLSWNERLHYFSFSVRKLPLGCFVTSPRNDDPARSEAAGGRSQRWRHKGALQAFFQASPKLACFAPSFSKQSFGGFVRFQGVTRFPNVL